MSALNLPTRCVNPLEYKPSSSEMQTKLPPGVVVNQHGPVPERGGVEAFDGLVAGPSFHSGSIVTSPNATFIPRFAIAHSEVITFTDGRWGRHEYSRWPQAFDRDFFHMACIPEIKTAYCPKADILWRTWENEDWMTANSGVVRMGQLQPALLNELDRAAERAILDVQHCLNDSEGTRTTERFLTVCLRHCLDRLRLLPADRAVIIALAAHVQRLALELVGLRVFLEIVQPRIHDQCDYRFAVLDVLGAHTSNPSVAQLLHRVGVPVWFQQPFPPNVAIWRIALPRDIPTLFSKTPAYPRLVLAVRDLSGALNTPGEAHRALTAAAYRQLCASQLPQLQRTDQTADDTPVAKKARLMTQWPNQWDSTLDHARPVLAEQAARDARTLPHDLKPVPPRPTSSKTRPARNRNQPHASLTSGTSKPGFVMNPFRQYYPSSTMHENWTWWVHMTCLEPLPQPGASVTYYFPPPWMFDKLNNYETPNDRRVRYIHHFVTIRMFCRMRLFDRTIAGRPLTVAEWRDALWGDYETDGGHEGSETSAGGSSTRAKTRHRLQQSLRELFGHHGGLPSYDVNSAPELGSIVVTAEAAANDEEVLQRVIWEAHETNWRCELLALDALVTGCRDWDRMERWVREAHVSEVWGPPRSGLDICPDRETATTHYCWPDSALDKGWEAGRPHLQAFVEVLARWPTRPAAFADAKGVSQLSQCDANTFSKWQGEAIRFYINTFVKHFQRLPTSPVQPRIRRRV